MRGRFVREGRSSAFLTTAYWDRARPTDLAARYQLSRVDEKLSLLERKLALLEAEARLEHHSRGGVRRSADLLCVSPPCRASTSDQGRILLAAAEALYEYGAAFGF